MEWLVLFAFVAVAAVAIALPAGPATTASGGEELRTERAQLLAELAELDDDLTAGRISAEDRRAGRRTLAPRLRSVTETLRARGDLDAERSER
jgi:hypothetical protein